MSTIRVYETDSEEYKRLETAVTLLNAYCSKATYRVKVVYFDLGQDWMWTTITVDTGSSWGGYQISPAEQEAIVFAETMEELVEACNAIMVR